MVHIKLHDLKHVKDKTFAIVDVETTGGSSSYDRVIEIGILRIENGKIVKKFQSLINPERSLPTFITSVTGITSAELEHAPTFDSLAEQIYDLLEGAIFVAHNARFDYGFLKNEFKRADVSFQAKCLCTVRLSRKMFPEHSHHDLTSIIERYHFACKNRHRAYDDAGVLWDLMKYIDKLGRGEEMASVIADLIKTTTLPQHLDEKCIQNLPTGPGVYIFYGPEDEVLYVGKSINIRDRVLSHFSNDHQSSKEMHLCQQTRRIETRRTAGELGALLLESELVKEMQPLYNRMLRKTSLLVVAKRIKTKDGYSSVTIERVKGVDPDRHAEVMGIFRSLNQAKEFISNACKEHGLCPKILGIEKTPRACFSHQIGKCSGACIGKADVDEFNELFEKAFEDRRVQAWMFDGPVIIEERGEDETHSFILDNWCLLGDSKFSNTGDASESQPTFYPRSFSYDSYKIFARYMREAGNRR